ncbi:hypothetical protein [Butyrivibrio sp. AC2005]|uniref:hypothetical protein n=1 Tax=Butyrivibrio sp. AC2005 TaxID=1280672 RepID=UPI000401194F|nr:hypothetical protein [Butyrivibrio sp. AC2005]
MKKMGINILKKVLASALAAAFIVSAVPANTIPVKAATKVEIDETTQAIGKKGKIVYKETGNKIVTITPGSYAKNVLSITVSDADAKIKNIKCAKKLKYKLSRVEYDSNTDKIIYRFSFYTKTAPKKLFKFKFTVNGENYFAYINAISPIAKATFGNQELSTKYGLGSQNYVTDLSKGKIKVTMSDNYSLESIQVGKYKNVSNGKDTEPVLYWETAKNNKKVILSSERQVIDTNEHDTKEESMYATTIIRVNYKYLKNGSTGSVDYYFNRIVNADN